MKQRAYLLYAGFVVGAFVLLTIGCGIGAAAGVFMNPIALAIISIALILGFCLSKGVLKQVFFVLFCLGEGVFLTPLLAYYAELDSSIIPTTLSVLAIIVGVFLFVGIWIRDLSWMGCFLFYGLIGLLVATVLGLMFPLPHLTELGVVLFSLYIAYDINRFKRVIDDSNGDLSVSEIADHAMTQFLNILNVLIRLLEIVAEKD